MSIETYIEYNPRRRTTALWLRMSTRFNGDREVEQLNITSKKLSLDDITSEIKPSIELDKEEMDDFLQAIVDLAWKEGIKPTAWDYEGPAQKEYLDSMKQISAQLLDFVTKE